MVRIFYISGSTYIDYGKNNEYTLRTDNLTMEQALLLALDIGCDFDYDDITSDEVDDCIKLLRDDFNLLIGDGSLELSKFATNYANIICKKR